MSTYHLLHLALVLLQNFATSFFVSIIVGDTKKTKINYINEYLKGRMLFFFAHNR